MKKIVIQVVGYIVILVIITSIIWGMMYKYNEKLKLEQGGHALLNNMHTITTYI